MTFRMFLTRVAEERSIHFSYTLTLTTVTVRLFELRRKLSHSSTIFCHIWIVLQCGWKRRGKIPH